MPEKGRTPVSMAIAAGGRTLVVCDDGTVWEEYGAGAGWKQLLAPIPGTQADKPK